METLFSLNYPFEWKHFYLFLFYFSFGFIFMFFNKKKKNAKAYNTLALIGLSIPLIIAWYLRVYGAENTNFQDYIALCLLPAIPLFLIVVVTLLGADNLNKLVGSYIRLSIFPALIFFLGAGKFNLYLIVVIIGTLLGVLLPRLFVSKLKKS